jgi:hypothetical protein
LGGRHFTHCLAILPLEFKLDHWCEEVNTFSIFSIGLTEIATLIGVTSLTCSLPAIGALIVAIIVLRHKEAYPAEQE